MIPLKVKTVYNRIKDLKIQGATAVAVAAMKAVENLKGKDFTQSVNYLKKTRPTEPLMFNGFKFIENYGTVDEFFELKDKANQKITEYGAKRIKKKDVVFIHCHSSTVMRILKKAHKQKKKIQVYVSESRPRYQGRISAKELVGYGIPTTLVVDSAQRIYINECDLALVGSDSLTSNGTLINKIGTAELAMEAKEARVPFATACSLMKFDPKTIAGNLSPIESRSRDEIWKGAPKKLKIKNPAFDTTDPERIDFVVTEAGIITAYDIARKAEKLYPWIFD